MHEPDSHALEFDEMRLAHALVGIEPEAMAVKAFVAVADRGDNRRDYRQLVEHAVHVDVARVHHEIDAAKYLEDLGGQMLAGFGDMSVGNQADSHHAAFGAKILRNAKGKGYHGRGASAILPNSSRRVTIRTPKMGPRLLNFTRRAVLNAHGSIADAPERRLALLPEEL